MDYRFASAAVRIKPSIVRDVLKLTQDGDIISFAGGLPAEELFPVEALKEASERVFSAGRRGLQYGITEGFMPLRELLCEEMASKGMNVAADQIIATTGSQQAIHLIVSVLTEPGDVVLVEQPTYLAALQVFELCGLRVIAAESDEQGIIPESAEQLMKQHKPRLMYVVPTFGNPTGNVWSIERRESMLALCRDHAIPILEDDPYSDIRFHKEDHYPTLLALEGRVDKGTVIYTSTFSKTIAPALRTGWAVGDKAIIQMMGRVKQVTDLHSSLLDQQLLYQLLKHFDLNEHKRIISESYHRRSQEIQEALIQKSLADVSWNQPKGGMFLWLELPDGLDAEALLRAAVRNGVAFVPGRAFYSGEHKRNTARLNFSCNNRDRTLLGVDRFAETVNEFLARS